MDSGMQQAQQPLWRQAFLPKCHDQVVSLEPPLSTMSTSAIHVVLSRVATSIGYLDASCAPRSL